jgi:hypothetical protein
VFIPIGTGQNLGMPAHSYNIFSAMENSLSAMVLFVLVFACVCTVHADVATAQRRRPTGCPGVEEADGVKCFGTQVRVSLNICLVAKKQLMID